MDDNVERIYVGLRRRYVGCVKDVSVGIVEIVGFWLREVEIHILWNEVCRSLRIITYTTTSVLQRGWRSQSAQFWFFSTSVVSWLCVDDPMLCKLFGKVVINEYIWAASWQTNKLACVPSEDSDLPRLIWVFAGGTVILLVLSWGGSFSLLWPTLLFVIHELEMDDRLFI